MTDPTQPLYALRDMQHCYGERTILDLPALDIAHSEVLGIVGPSGSGKTTLLRLLQFLEAPTRGSIIFDGEHLNGRIDLSLRRRVATVFQSPALLDRSVYDNVAYGLQSARCSSPRFARADPQRARSSGVALPQPRAGAHPLWR